MNPLTEISSGLANPDELMQAQANNGVETGSYQRLIDTLVDFKACPRSGVWEL